MGSELHTESLVISNMVVWKLVVKIWSLERKHRGGLTSAVPRELAQENVNVARIKLCRRSSE